MTSSTPASERALEGWESVPADSETQVDYPQDLKTALTEALKVTETPRARILLERAIELVPDTGELASLGILAPLTGYPPELTVDINVVLPDGRRFVFQESVEYTKDSDGFVEHFELEDVTHMIETLSRSALLRFE